MISSVVLAALFALSAKADPPFNADCFAPFTASAGDSCTSSGAGYSIVLTAIKTDTETSCDPQDATYTTTTDCVNCISVAQTTDCGASTITTGFLTTDGDLYGSSCTLDTNTATGCAVEETSTEDLPDEETSTEDSVPEETTTEDSVPEETTTEESEPEETTTEESEPEETTTEDSEPEETTTEDSGPEETTTEDEIVTITVTYVVIEDGSSSESTSSETEYDLISYGTSFSSVWTLLGSLMAFLL